MKKRQIRERLKEVMEDKNFPEKFLVDFKEMLDNTDFLDCLENTKDEPLERYKANIGEVMKQMRLMTKNLHFCIIVVGRKGGVATASTVNPEELVGLLSHVLKEIEEEAYTIDKREIKD